MARSRPCRSTLAAAGRGLLARRRSSRSVPSRPRAPRRSLPRSSAEAARPARTSLANPEGSRRAAPPVRPPLASPRPACAARKHTAEVRRGPRPCSTRCDGGNGSGRKGGRAAPGRGKRAARQAFRSSGSSISCCSGFSCWCASSLVSPWRVGLPTGLLCGRCTVFWASTAGLTLRAWRSTGFGCWRGSYSRSRLLSSSVFLVFAFSFRRSAKRSAFFIHGFFSTRLLAVEAAVVSASSLRNGISHRTPERERCGWERGSGGGKSNRPTRRRRGANPFRRGEEQRGRGVACRHLSARRRRGSLEGSRGHGSRPSIAWSASPLSVGLPSR